MTLSDWILEGYKDVLSQPACTSLPQQWDKPRGNKIRAEPVSSMVIAKPGNLNRKRKPLSAVLQDNRKIKVQEEDISFLQGLSGCPLPYLATKPHKTVETGSGLQSVGSALGYQVPLIQAVDLPTNNHTDCGQLDFPTDPPVDIPVCVTDNSDKWNHLYLTREQALALERNTRDHSSCEMWHKERQSRLTASIFGRIILRKALVSDKFVESIMKPKPFTSVATSYGINSEKVAKNMYRKKTGNHVHDSGFIVNPKFPFIGATPDGKVCEKGISGILEVKCPFSIRDWLIADALDNLENNNDQITLKKIMLTGFKSRASY